MRYLLNVGVPSTTVGPIENIFGFHDRVWFGVKVHGLHATRLSVVDRLMKSRKASVVQMDVSISALAIRIVHCQSTVCTRVLGFSH